MNESSLKLDGTMIIPRKFNETKKKQSKRKANLDILNSETSKKQKQINTTRKKRDHLQKN